MTLRRHKLKSLKKRRNNQIVAVETTTSYSIQLLSSFIVGYFCDFPFVTYGNKENVKGVWL
jgi:hypothetical protein